MNNLQDINKSHIVSNPITSITSTSSESIDNNINIKMNNKEKVVINSNRTKKEILFAKRLDMLKGMEVDFKMKSMKFKTLHNIHKK